MTQQLLTIAIIPNKMLGDGVISLVLANNLYQNGIDVTVFHDYLMSLNDWLNFKIMPTDTCTLNETSLNGYDIVLADTYSTFTSRYNQKQIKELAKTIIFFSSGKLEAMFYHDHQDYLANKLTGDLAKYIPSFIAASQTLKHNPTHSMVDNMILYCSETLKLPIITSDTGLKLPASLIKKNTLDELFLHPPAARKRKNGRQKNIFAWQEN